MRRYIALTLASLIALAPAACGDPLPVQPAPPVEVEDCDMEDWANREDDCGFSDSDRLKTPRPKVPTVKTPGPKVSTVKVYVPPRPPVRRR